VGGGLRFIIPETGFMYISGKAMDCFASLAMTEGVAMTRGGGNGGKDKYGAKKRPV